MQLAWSKIWTRVAVSISYDDNHYTTGTSIIIIMVEQYMPAVNHFYEKKRVFQSKNSKDKYRIFLIYRQNSN